MFSLSLSLANYCVDTLIIEWYWALIVRMSLCVERISMIPQRNTCNAHGFFIALSCYFTVIRDYFSFNYSTVFFVIVFDGFFFSFFCFVLFYVCDSIEFFTFEVNYANATEQTQHPATIQFFL